MLSDATGWGTGGVSDIQRELTAPLTLTPGVQISQDPSCLSTLALADFYFWTEPVDLPQQCSPMRVAWNDENVTYPLGLHGFVPGGSAWDIPVPQERGQVSANWTVNIDSGTRFILLMTDAGRYGTGGSSPPITVQYSGNDTCMGPDSPRSTVGLTPTASPSSSPSTSKSPSSSPSGAGGSNAGAIAGGVIGGIVGLALLLAAIWLFCRQRKRGRTDNGAMVSDSRRRSEETRTRLLGRLTNQRNGGHERNGRRPHSSFEIDVFEGQHPDDARSDVDHGETDPHMTPFTYGPPHPDSSMLSTDSSRSYPGPPLPPAAPAGRPGQFGEKDMLALSRGGSSAPGSTSMSDSSGRGPRRFEDLRTVSELAIDSANSGRPVDREALLAFLDPPPTYQFEMHAANPDEHGDRTSRVSGSTDARPTSTAESGPSRPRRSEEPGHLDRPDGQ